MARNALPVKYYIINQGVKKIVACITPKKVGQHVPIILIIVRKVFQMPKNKASVGIDSEACHRTLQPLLLRLDRAINRNGKVVLSRKEVRAVYAFIDCSNSFGEWENKQ